MQKIRKKTRALLSDEHDRIIARSKTSASAVVFDTGGLPTKHVQALREKLKSHGSVVKSKKKFMKKALQGYGEALPALPENAHVLFVERDLDGAVEVLQAFSGESRLRAGDAAPEMLSVSKGVVKAGEAPVSVVHKKTLEDLGVPVAVENDTLVVGDEFCICREGDAISPDAEKILRILRMGHCVRRVQVLSVLQKNK